jgi:hypothetical protein
LVALKQQLRDPAPIDDTKAPPMTEKPISGKADMFDVHMTLQHKGGVTKSFCANCLAQFYQATGRAVAVLDADPSNKSLAAYKALNVRSVDILCESNSIDSRKFDDIVESFIVEETDFIVDNGATNFLAFMSYLVSNNVSSILSEAGRRLILHIPIVGGEALNETMSGFDDIAGNLGADAKLVIWLNEAVKGVITFDGKEFEDSRAYDRHKTKILGLIRVPHHTSELFARDMEVILSKKLTFSEAIGNPEIRLMSKQRLKQMQREIFDQIAVVV